MPDRTLALDKAEQGDFKLLNEILKEFEKTLDLFLELKNFNCKTLAIPCNSLFCFFKDTEVNGKKIKGIESLLKNYPFKAINMIEATAKFVKKHG